MDEELLKLLNFQNQGLLNSGIGSNKWMENFDTALANYSSNTTDNTVSTLPKSNFKLTGAAKQAQKTVANDFNSTKKRNKWFSNTDVDNLGFMGGSTNMFKMGNAAMDLTGAAIDPLDHRTGMNTALDIGSAVAGMVPGPWGQAISMGLKGVNLLDQALGKNAESQVTAGATATGYDLKQNANAATKYGGLFGNKKRKQTNALTKRYDAQNIAKIGVSNANQKNMLASSNSMQDIAKKNYGKLQGGYRTNILAAKKGTKLAMKRLAGEVREVKERNVIPSGALHARKHNLPEEIAKHVTHKGIPVISKESGGDIVQHAEIEHSEIIFTKAVTDKLEALLKKGDDEAAIEAGKLLTTEILENTEDNTNLIETV